MIRITTKDVGATQVATIWVGETEAISFYTQTKHPWRSAEIAEQAVARALRKLIEPDVEVYTDKV